MANACLITGGARGIGRATARLAAASGWDVAINYRERFDVAGALAQEIEATGRRAVAIRTDVGKEDEILSMFAHVEQSLGPVKRLVNCVGISHHNRVDALCVVELERMFAINVIGMMIFCREAAKRMSSKYGGPGGSIVNVSSMAATNGGRIGHSSYAASKGAVDVFTMGFAKEVGAEGIRVNVVRPSVTDTDMVHYMRSGPGRAAVEATIPMKRFARPEEVAEAIVWLLSDKASFVTGSHVNVGGGCFLIGAG